MRLSVPLFKGTRVPSWQTNFSSKGMPATAVAEPPRGVAGKVRSAVASALQAVVTSRKQLDELYDTAPRPPARACGNPCLCPLRLRAVAAAAPLVPAVAPRGLRTGTARGICL